jgi:uncharacterized protein (TIGR03435 family)
MRGGPGTQDPEQFTASNVILMNLVLSAYGLSTDQVSGPGWLDTERYSIVAKVPHGTTRKQFQEMLRNVLTDRFHLAAHLVKKDFEAYEMTIAKDGLKTRESVIEVETGSPAPAPNSIPVNTPLTFKDGFPELPIGESPALRGINVNGRELITARKQTMTQLASTLQGFFVPGVRVVDKTALTGKYDYYLQFAQQQNADGAPAWLGVSGADFLDSIGEPVPELITAVDRQLGLRLTKNTLSMDVLIVDHVDKIPTED